MSDDMISRQAAIHLLEEMKELDYELWIRTNGYSHLSEEQWDWLIDNFKELNEVPSVQPEQKIWRETGRWEVQRYYGEDIWMCSKCSKVSPPGEWVFCPNCGARMEDGQ